MALVSMLVHSEILQYLSLHFASTLAVHPNLAVWCSGAGKTTLMDVIAGRKTQGKITGDILVNGELSEKIIIIMILIINNNASLQDHRRHPCEW